MNKSISILKWHQMAIEEKAPPVRILLNGHSMNPAIRGYKDYVTIIEKEMVLTWGDNCSDPDGWIPLKNIWGRVVLIEKGKKRSSQFH